jgi:hypothetical protein
MDSREVMKELLKRAGIREGEEAAIYRDRVLIFGPEVIWGQIEQFCKEMEDCFGKIETKGGRGKVFIYLPKKFIQKEWQMSCYS